MGRKTYVTIVGGPHNGEQVMVDGACRVIHLLNPEENTEWTAGPVDISDALLHRVELRIRTTPNGLLAYWSERKEI